MRPTGYRLHLKLWRRIVTVAILVLCGLFFLSGVVASDIDFWWRLFSVLGLVLAVLGLRTVLGHVVVVGPKGVRIQRNWPIRREFQWHRILLIDVIPGYWHLEMELNSGERVVLPAVEKVDELYRQMEKFRTAIDAA